MGFKIIALATLVSISGIAAQANELSDGPHIVTSSTAGVDAVLDTTTPAIEVSVAAKDAATVKRQVDKRVTQCISFLELNRIAKKGISPTSLRTQLGYDYQDGKSILRGYRAVRAVEVTLHQLGKLNSLLNDALETGLDETRSVSLDVTQSDIYKDKARKATIGNAIHQAQELANGFNRELGPVYSVCYHVSNYRPGPMVRVTKADATPVFVQETYEQAAIQSGDQADVIFQLEPVNQPLAKTPTAHQYLQSDILARLMSLPGIVSFSCKTTT